MSISRILVSGTILFAFGLGVVVAHAQAENPRVKEAVFQYRMTRQSPPESPFSLLWPSKLTFSTADFNIGDKALESGWTATSLFLGKLKPGWSTKSDIAEPVVPERSPLAIVLVAGELPGEDCATKDKCDAIAKSFIDFVGSRLDPDKARMSQEDVKSSGIQTATSAGMYDWSTKHLKDCYARFSFGTVRRKLTDALGKDIIVESEYRILVMAKGESCIAVFTELAHTWDTSTSLGWTPSADELLTIERGLSERATLSIRMQKWGAMLARGASKR
ncbi:MAG: hypothetical protein P4L46_08240 [Fimbriimonas sp.]|nr:hypothetical protein [Fimbriimonas sp.]